MFSVQQFVNLLLVGLIFMYFSMTMMHFNKVFVHKLEDKAFRSMIRTTGLAPELVPSHHHMLKITATEALMCFSNEDLFLTDSSILLEKR